MKVDIEKALLSAAIFDGTVDELLKYEIEPYYFLHPAYRRIYEVMLKLHEKGFPIEETFILKNLNKEYETPLIEILSANPVIISEHYINILKEHYTLDQIANFSRNNLKRLSEEDSLDKIKKNIYQFVEDLDNKENNELFESFQYNPDLKEDVEFVCKEFLPFPKKTVSMVTAGGGTGKTWLMLNVAIREANRGKKVFAWMSEDPLSETMNRIYKIHSELIYGIDEQVIRKNLTVSNSNTLHMIDKKGEINYNFYKFKQMLKDYELIILDPLIGFYGSDENDNVHARVFMQLFTEWASAENKTIIFIHHSTKNTTQSRGASAFVDAVRLVYEIERIEDDQLNRNIKLAKDNYNVVNIIKKREIKRELFPAKVIKSVDLKSQKNSKAV